MSWERFGQRVFHLCFGGSTAVCLAILLLFPVSQTNAQTTTPTPDRLAAPPTVPAPTQADEGAQLYWLHCQPCHGDVGQGLSDADDDDWRAQYPEEDQYCWNSGCHGARPYEEGFVLPKQVPAVIGEATLSRFATVADVYHYVRVAMPFQAPTTLTDEEYLAIVAFLAGSHEVGDKLPLTAVSAQEVVLNQSLLPVPTATPLPTAVPTITPTVSSTRSVWLIAGGLLILLIIGGVLWLKQTR